MKSIGRLLVNFILSILLIQLIPEIYFFKHNFCVDAIFEESHKAMSGRVIRVGVIHYPPVMIITKNPDGTSTYGGTAFELLNVFAKHLNISYKPVSLKLSSLLKYGLVNVQVNHIVENETDLEAFGIDLSHPLSKKIDLSVPVVQEAYNMVVPWPSEESRFLAPIRPFQPWVWFCLGLTLVVMSPVLAALSELYVRYVQPNDGSRRSIITFESLLHNSTFLLSHLTNQGYRYDLRLKSRGSFLLVGIWCLMCVVLANGYAGTFFSFMSIIKLEKPINSVAELVYSSDVKLLIQGQTGLADRYLNATSGIEKAIGDSLRNNPGTLFSVLGEAIKMLMTGKYAFTYFDIFNYAVIDTTYKLGGKKCKTTFAKTPIITFSPICFGYALNGPYTKAFDEQIQASIDAGLILRFMRNGMPNVDQCRMENQTPDARAKPLTLTDMASCFIILGLGISFSFLIFLFEIVYKRISDNCFNKKNRVIKIRVKPAEETMNDFQCENNKIEIEPYEIF